LYTRSVNSADVDRQILSHKSMAKYNKLFTAPPSLVYLYYSPVSKEVVRMTIRIAKGTIGAQPNRQTHRPTLQQSSKAARPKTIEKPPAIKKTSRAPVIAAVMAVIGIIFMLCLLSPSQSPPPQARPAVVSVQPTITEKHYEPRHPAELGGLTMAEWERKNNTNNVLLEGRKEQIGRAHV
jgi:hypothetical protein